MKQLVSIHYLRGMAAFAVLMFHAIGYASGYGSGRLNPALMKIGEAGVDVFFVISGFVLTLATERPTSRAAFLRGRLLRVGVPYWVITLALALASLALPGAFRAFQWSGPDLALSLAFVPSIAKDGALFPLLDPGWTLSLEALFYLLLALGLGLAPARRAMVLSATLVGLALAGIVLRPTVGVLWFFTQAVLVEFAIGIGLARLYLARRHLPASLAPVLLTLSLCLFVVAAMIAPDAFGRLRPLVYGLPAALLVAGLVVIEDTRGLPRLRIAAFLGDISYSLYLVHVLVLAVVAKLLGARIAGVAGDAGLIVAMIAAALAAAMLFHAVVERPALARANRRKAEPQAGSAPTGPARRPVVPLRQQERGRGLEIAG